jgi:hypothetical protein
MNCSARASLKHLRVLLVVIVWYNSQKLEYKEMNDKLIQVDALTHNQEISIGFQIHKDGLECGFHFLSLKEATDLIEELNNAVHEVILGIAA